MTVERSWLGRLRGQVAQKFFGWNRHLEALLRFKAISSDDVVLDVGSGNGKLLKHLTALTGCSGVGLEVDAALHDDALQFCAAEILQNKLTFLNTRFEDVEVCGRGFRHHGVFHRVSTVFLYVYAP